MHLGPDCFQHSFLQKSSKDGGLFIIPTFAPTDPSFGRYGPIVQGLLSNRSKIKFSTHDYSCRWLKFKLEGMIFVLLEFWCLSKKHLHPERVPAKAVYKLFLCISKAAWGIIKMQTFWESCKMVFTYITQQRKGLSDHTCQYILSIFFLPFL